MSKFLPTRLLTAAALMGAIALVSLSPDSLKLSMVGLVLILCWREWLRMAGIASPLPRSVAIILFALALALPVVMPPPHLTAYAVMALGVAWWSLALVVLRNSGASIGNGAAAACGLLGLAPAWLAVLALIRADQAYLLLVLLLLVGAADTGAFVIGKLLGRRPLAPVLSSGKTVEGAWGGLATATIAGLGASFYLEQSALYWTLAGLAVGGLSMLGDLTVSLFKRRAGLKDTGRMLPGHGGVLDRMDSSLATAPLLALIAFEPFGWLPL